MQFCENDITMVEVRIPEDEIVVHVKRTLKINRFKLPIKDGEAGAGFNWLVERGYNEIIPDSCGFAYVKNSNEKWHYADLIGQEIYTDETPDPILNRAWVLGKVISESEWNGTISLKVPITIKGKP